MSLLNTNSYNNLGLLSELNSMDFFMDPVVLSRRTRGEIFCRSPKNEGNNTIVEVEVPGVNPSDLRVKIEGKSLTVETPNDRTYMTLGHRLDSDGATATLKHGLLTVTIPRREAKVVEVQVSES